MMAHRSVLNLQIVTPTQEVFQGSVDSFIVTSVEGELGILPNHAPLLAPLKVGRVALKRNGQATTFQTDEGLLSLNHEGQAVVLCRSAKTV
jgi:F-type H+-transporting ATPase subunit epsilon